MCSVREVTSWEEEVLFHYSEEADKTFCMARMRGDNDHKPGGLWLSDDSDYGWRAFVLDRVNDGSPCWADADKGLRYKYGFTINPCCSDKILKLKTPDDLRCFTAHYREAARRACDEPGGYGVHIDWERVRAHYKGILITPFTQTWHWQVKQVKTPSTTGTDLTVPADAFGT